MSLNGKEPFYRKLAENCSICAFRYPVIIIIRHFPSHSSKLLAAVLVLQFDYFPAALLYVSRALPMAWRVIMISVPGVVCAWVRRTVERNQRGDVVQLRHATAQIQNSRTWCSSKYEAASSHCLQYGLLEKRKTENTSEFPTEWWSVGVDLRLVSSFKMMVTTLKQSHFTHSSRFIPVCTAEYLGQTLCSTCTNNLITCK